MREMYLSWMVLVPVFLSVAAQWHPAPSFLNNEIDDVDEHNEDEATPAAFLGDDIEEPKPPKPSYATGPGAFGTGVPTDFERDLAGLRIPHREDLPGRNDDEESDEEDEGGEKESEESDESDESDEGEESDESNDEDESDEFHFDEHHKKKKGHKKPRPVVKYEVKEIIPGDRKPPRRPEGPVYPGPPPCPGHPPPTFPPTEAPGKGSTSKPGTKSDFFDSYFPSSYMSQTLGQSTDSHTTGQGTSGGGGGTFGYAPFHQGSHHYFGHGHGHHSSILGLDSHHQPVTSPQSEHRVVAARPHSHRIPRRASPQRVIVRYHHRPALVIKKIQQYGPGADAIIIRRPAPIVPVKEVHIHHHHSPAQAEPVIHVHTDDEADFLQDSQFKSDLVRQKTLSEADIEAALGGSSSHGQFAEPLDDFMETKRKRKKKV